MKIGKVKWFGAYNGFNYSPYGFLQQLDSDEDLFFHQTGIDKNSKFLNEYKNDCYVAYEIAPSKKKNKIMAINIKLLTELNLDEQNKVYQSYKDNFKIFLPYLEDSLMSNLFLQNCKKLDLKELKEKLGTHLLDEQVKNIFIQEIPEIYLNTDVKEYFKIIDHNKNAYELLLKRYYEGYFNISIVKEYGKWIRENDFSSSNQKKFAEKFFEKINWNKESVEDIIFMIKQAKLKKISIKTILFSKPNLIFSDANICKLIEKDDILKIPLKEIITSKEQLHFLETYLKSDANLKNFIYNQICDDLLINSKDALQNVGDKKFCEIISSIDWRNIEKDNLDKYKYFISFIQADVHEQAATMIAYSMKEQKIGFEISWWELFTDSVKIRILIYYSNFKEEKQSWLKMLKSIYLLERHNDNKLLLAILKYFANIYYNDNKQRCQSNFMEAHKELMEYITDCFTSGLDITHALNTLLDKCFIGYKKKPYFCDARIWNNKGKIFCPEGNGRPKNGRTVCQYHSDMDLTKTKYQETKKYKDQYFTDFLLNIGYIPDLRSIGISEVIEYSYRISAFVNRLIDIQLHMKCSKCGEYFYPNFKYAILKTARLAVNRYNCKHQSIGHDSNIYINYCYHCSKIIDSRECKLREPFPYGQYLCMHCGGTEHIEPGTQCPVCGNIDSNLLDLKGNDRIICKKCGYDAKNFRSKFEETENDLLFILD